ncbi:MAG TPA: RES family NAD+ phosphorylase, partial [Casimicrobiaceae bacterium]
METPPVRLVHQRDTHRLVSCRHLPDADSVLTRIADDEDLAAVFELDAATNDRLHAEHVGGPGIGPEELVAAVPLASVVNAAFAHPHPLGARFSGPERGAWYAAFELETAQAEVAFHKGIELAEVGWRDESVTYDDYVADFNAEFHDIRRARAFRACLAPDSYQASQALASRLLAAGSLGVVYPSVRHAGGT